MVHSHSIYVVSTYPTPDHWRREIFSRIMQHISEGYAVAYVGEENETAAVQQFSRMGMSIEDHVEEGSLTIISRDVFYSPFVPSNILLDQWKKLFVSIEKKTGKGKYKGFVAVGMPADSFFISELDNQQLVRYESLAAKKYNGSLEAMCLYTTEMIQTMPLRHVISLLNAHQNTGHSDGTREWNSKRGLAAIKRGLDSALGPSVTEMVLPIIVRDSEMREEALVLHPDQLERKLELLLGASAAGVVISHIMMEISKDIVY